MATQPRSKRTRAFEALAPDQIDRCLPLELHSPVARRPLYLQE